MVTFTKGWSEAYGLFMKGEADMVMSYTTSPAYHISAEKKDNYKAAAFSEGHYLHVELAGMTRTRDQPRSWRIESRSSCSSFNVSCMRARLKSLTSMPFTIS